MTNCHQNTCQNCQDLLSICRCRICPCGIPQVNRPTHVYLAKWALPTDLFSVHFNSRHAEEFVTTNVTWNKTKQLLTHWPLGDANDRWVIFMLILVTDASLVKLSSDECNWTLLMISQHWYRWWRGAVRQQAITWASVDPDLCRQIASLGPNKLILIQPFSTCDQ